MGLDIVEIVMSVEEEFDVKIPDEEAGEIVTFGDLFDWLKERCGGRSGPCLTSAAFYAVRRGLMNITGIDRTSVRPKTDLRAFFPKAQRPGQWKALEASLGLKLPALAFPSWLTRTIVTGSAAMGLATFFLLLPSASIVVRVLSALLMGFFAAHLGFRAMAKQKTIWSFTPTVGELARSVLSENYLHFNEVRPSWNDEEAERKLRSIVVEQLGVEPKRVTRDASFIDHLGAD